MNEEKKSLIRKTVLHPKQYDEEESSAMEKIPNRIIQCCRPQAFYGKIIRRKLARLLGRVVMWT